MSRLPSIPSPMNRPWVNGLARTLSVLLAVATLVSCASSIAGTPYDPDDPRLAGARLEIVGSNTFNVPLRGTATMEVLYVFADGEPIAGAPLQAEITGLAAGSTLDFARVSTGRDGRATIGVAAGAVMTEFPVQVFPPEGNEVTFRVGVGQDGTGSISIEQRYSGDATFDLFRPYLLRAVSCDDLSVSSLPAAVPGLEVRSLSDRPSFGGVSPGDDWVVAVVATGPRDVLAFGCSVGVNVVAGEETRVTVDLLDTVPDLVFRGRYDVASVFDFSGALPPSLDSALGILDELTDDNDIDGFTEGEYGQDPGAFVTDIIMRQTCAWECGAGEDFSSCATINHPLGDLRAIYEEDFTRWDGAQSRFFGGCGGWELGARTAQNWINLQIGNWVPDGIRRFIDSAGDIARAITQARIQSILILGEPDEFNRLAMDHEMFTMTVMLRDLDGSAFTSIIDLRDLGVSTIPAETGALVRGETLIIPPHSFNIDFGRLVRHIYLNVLLDRLGYASTEEMLNRWINCEGIADRIHEAIEGVTDRLSRDQYRDYCESGIGAAGGFIDDNIGGLVPANGIFTISGEVQGAEVTPDRLAQRLTEGVWTGSFDEAGTSMSIRGTFEGQLFIAPP